MSDSRHYTVLTTTTVKKHIVLSESEVEAILIDWAKDRLQFGGNVEVQFDVGEYLRGVTIYSKEDLAP